MNTLPKVFLIHRNRKKPEFLRKLEFIFDHKIIFNLLLLVCLFVIIILYSIIYNLIVDLKNSTYIFDTKLTDILKETSNNKVFSKHFLNQKTLDIFLNKSLSVGYYNDWVKLIGGICSLIISLKVKKKQYNNYYIIIKASRIHHEISKFF